MTFYQYGMDCDDADANVYGGSDNDGDGYLACYADCDDYDPNVNNGATETWYDGVDQDCDGLSDYDQDMDGDDDINYGGTDCDDQDPTVEGLDIDGDGVSTCDGDCDDSDETIYAGATETWYDGIDQDCSGGSDYDQDGDGEESYDSGMGMDCDDTDANTIGDDDGDGYFVCETVPDCDDGDGTVYPGATEIFDDGIDQDCDGADMVGLSSCFEYYQYDNTLPDGEYDVIDAAGNAYAVYCNMTNGGWTLAVNAQGNNQSFGSTASLWYTAGQTTEVISLSTSGKSPAYDSMPLSELMLTQAFGLSSVVADVTSDAYSSTSLLAMVANTPYSTGAPGSNNGSSAWNNGFKSFSAISSGSYFTQSYIKIWHGDRSTDTNDYVVFSAGSNSHGDWSGANNLGAVGGEFRMGGSTSDTTYYSIWIR